MTFALGVFVFIVLVCFIGLMLAATAAAFGEPGQRGRDFR